MTELYGKAAAAPIVNASAIGRLLQEVSWEGGANLRRYRDGGCGRENVLTAEVLQALDFLPRDAFLGGILRASHGADAARGKAAAEIESAAVSILDEVQLNPSAPGRAEQLVVQPDALIRSANAYTLVELKGLRANMFGQRQLAKEYVTAVRAAGSGSPLVLLVMRHDPPLRVQNHGRLSLAEAVTLQLDEVLAGAVDHNLDHAEMVARIPEVFAWITWAEVGDVVHRQAHAFVSDNPSVAGTVRRLANSVAAAIEAHT